MKYLVLFLSFLCLSCGSKTLNGVTIREKTGEVTIQNRQMALVYNLTTGTYRAMDLKSNQAGVYDASCSVNDLKSSEPGMVHSYTIEAADDRLGKGATLRIVSKKEGAPSMIFTFTLYENRPAMIMRGGINNTTASEYRIHSIAPIDEASIFEGRNLAENFRVVDGMGGGAATFIRETPSIKSHNNMIVHFGNDSDFYSMVCGGVSYREFAKYASMGETAMRKAELETNPLQGLRLLNYLNLGVKNSVVDPSAPRITHKPASSYLFEVASGFEEAKSIIYHGEQLEFTLENLDKSKDYTFGITACDDGGKRQQSLWLEYDGQKIQIMEPTQIPDLSVAEKIYTYYYTLPKQAVAADQVKIVARNAKGANVVASEAILMEGALADGARMVEVKSPEIDYSKVKINLKAEDAIGKLVDAGVEFFASDDAFYLDFVTRSPIETADQYAHALRDEQQVKLNYYTFPTICLWYAMEPAYGGDLVMGTNDAPGAVDEMRRVKESGWLKYETMGVRLVPDCYGLNNENGWWNDEHWQMHGSGNQKEGMTLKGAHYRAPYETTKKWAAAVRELGGLPFTYFQTAVRSQDYAEAYPQHMLFNESNHKIDEVDWLNQGHGTYDFTDKDFVAHMKDVYKNLHDSKIQGMMFDYPYTGWIEYGGMDDKYMTTAGGYRRIYELAHNGLGEAAFIHERNLTHGSDVTFGLVESQRTWGDTDHLTPEMVLRSGMRWYKNRVVINYDMDAKNMLKAKPMDSPDGLNKLLTMSYVTASRLLLANSFGNLKPYHVQKLSRIYPFHTTAQSAAPLDAFISDYPRVYGMRIDDNWMSMTFYNEDDDRDKVIAIDLAGTPGRGGAGLDPKKEYWVYDFWNDALIGKFKGSSKFEQSVRRGEARQMALRAVETNPQVLSTDRHLLQGYLELSATEWDQATKTLKGRAKVIGGEEMQIAIALNSMKPTSASGTIIEVDQNLIKLSLKADQNGEIPWSVSFQ